MDVLGGEHVGGGGGIGDEKAQVPGPVGALQPLAQLAEGDGPAVLGQGHADEVLAHLILRPLGLPGEGVGGGLGGIQGFLGVHGDGPLPGAEGHGGVLCEVTDPGAEEGAGGQGPVGLRHQSLRVHADAQVREGDAGVRRRLGVDLLLRRSLGIEADGDGQLRQGVVDGLHGLGLGLAGDVLAQDDGSPPEGIALLDPGAEAQVGCDQHSQDDDDDEGRAGSALFRRGKVLGFLFHGEALLYFS